MRQDQRLACAAAVLLAALALPASRARADEIIKIAYIDPMSGAFALTGRQGEEAFRFAIERANAAGAAGPGRKFELEVLDNEVSPEKSLTVLRKAIDDGVHYITQGNGSSVAFALSDAVAKNNRRSPDHAVVFLNYAAVDPGLTNAKCNWWHFRFDADSDMKLQALTTYLVAQPAVHKVYIFNQDYSFGQDVEKTALKMLANRRADLSVVGTDRVPLGKVKDFTPYIQKMQAAGADSVVTGAWGSDLRLLLKAAADSGFKGRFFTFYLGTPDTVDAIGRAGEGDAVIGEYAQNGLGAPGVYKLAADFEAKYHYPFFYWRVVNEIDALAAAMKQADSSDPVKVSRALSGMRWRTEMGEEIMRADNHQLLQPMYVSELMPNQKRMFTEVGLGFKVVQRSSAEQTRMPTTCELRPPS